MVHGVSDRLATALEHPMRTRFLGRENELTLLQSLHKRVVEHRHPSMVLILGDAGVGKSRLIDEFLRLGELSSPTVYRGRCLAYGEGTTYWALREILWAAARIRFDDPAAGRGPPTGRCARFSGQPHGSGSTTPPRPRRSS
jgi:hypothetical protein